MSFAASNPGALRFRRDTLGIDVSVAIAGPLLFATWAALAIYWQFKIDVGSKLAYLVVHEHELAHSPGPTIKTYQLFVGRALRPYSVSPPPVDEEWAHAGTRNLIDVR